MKIFAFAVMMIFLTSCLKQSIPDAMLNKPDKSAITSTLNYEINGTMRSFTIDNAKNQLPNNRHLACEKNNGYYVFYCGYNAEVQMTFYADSLRPATYTSFPTLYVTTFEGYPTYNYAAVDKMTINISANKNGFINGTFSGRLTPALMQGNPTNIYGTPGSVVISNGSFTNVPVFY